MTDINIFLNVGVSESTVLQQVASLTGIPDELARNGTTFWVQAMVASIPVGDSFPVEVWFNSIPGQSTDLAMDKDSLFTFCRALEDAGDSEHSHDDSRALFAKLAQIAQELEKTNAHFNLVLDY